MPFTHAVLFFETESKSVVERLQFYLKVDTRPDSEDDVPVSEIDVFKAIKKTQTPDDIAVEDDLYLTAWFDFFGEEDSLEICNALHKLSGITGCYAFFTDDDEYKAYMHYKNGQFKTLYTYLDDDELDGKLWDLGWEIPGLKLILKSIDHKDLQY